MAAVVCLRGRRALRRFTVTDGCALRGGEVFGTCDTGSFDGVRVDDAGRVCVATHDGLHCSHPVGQSPDHPASPDGAKVEPITERPWPRPGRLVALVVPGEGIPG
ncbi:hypothetical protein [Micromonospora coriariae]|uniref:hypothetical protein n=1 Tax=Micromonospora coriariae TaxID=285665 RepID=UPI0012FDDBF1